MRQILTWIALTFALVPSAFSQDNMADHYAKVGKWDIYLDESVSGCFMIGSYKGGTWVRVGFIVLDNSVSTSVFIGDEDWKSIEYGKTYSIILDFGNGKTWTRTANGFSFDPPKNESVLHVVIPSSTSERSFLIDLMEARDVSVSYGSVEIANLTLTGSYQAGLKLLECQTSHASRSSDPFKSATTVDDDPFKISN